MSSELPTPHDHYTMFDSDEDIDPSPGSIADQPRSIRSSTRKLREGWRGSNEKPSIHHIPISTVYKDRPSPMASRHRNSTNSIASNTYSPPTNPYPIASASAEELLYQDQPKTFPNQVSAHNYESKTMMYKDSTESLGGRKEGGHRRTKSEGGGLVTTSQNFISITPQLENTEKTLFCEPISEKLICLLCKSVFREPVITNCGHTFCRQCVLSAAKESTCPTDGTQLSVGPVNIAIRDQVGELLIHCKYGCSPASSGVPGEYEIDNNGCPVTIKLSKRKEHEMNCKYAPVVCPNSSLCPMLIKMELDSHLSHCKHARCPHSRFSCPFEGTSDELVGHLESCRFEGMKEFLVHSEKQMNELKDIIKMKQKESDYLKGTISDLKGKLQNTELTFARRIDQLEERLAKVSTVASQNSGVLVDVEKQLASMDSRAFNLGAFDVQSVLKCKGTFVGHQGPVCTLCVSSSLLFSGSSDNSIKVWDTRSNYTCIATFTEHTGMVLALNAYRGRLYSGSADCTISVFDIDNLKLIENFRADDNAICTLAVANGMLFSGSLKSIKVWSLDSLKNITVLSPMNHWVRALATSENKLYCGAYKTIKVYDMKNFEPLHVIDSQGGHVYSLVVSTDYIIAGTYENCILVWNKNSYNKIAKLTGHAGIVYSLVLMTIVDSNRVISASYDGSLRVWSLDNMQCVQTLFRHQGSVTTLAVSRGRIFSGSVDRTVKVWQ